jgi:hypothetical protein
MLIKNILLKVTLILELSLVLTEFAEAQDGTDTSPVRIMFYNVENLFDINDDTLTDDNEFLPTGLRRWNYTRYNRKINSIYKTIIAAGEWEPPAIAGFCEVENRKVVHDLVNGTALSKYGYGIVHSDSPDERGIDVCMIFRKDVVRIISYTSWIPRFVDEAGFHSRSVLYTKCAILGDTLHLMVNHWPSRRGGVLAGESLRKEIALMIRNAVDSLYNASSGQARIIIMGDFNCTPDDAVIQILLQPGKTDSPSLINLADRDDLHNSGTYRYQGNWEMLDQIIVSESLIKGMDGLYTDLKGYTIFKPGFLLKNDSKYPGETTYSTYRGYKYQGGFSDHLPVLLDLGVR